MSRTVTKLFMVQIVLSGGGNIKSRSHVLKRVFINNSRPQKYNITMSIGRVPKNISLRKKKLPAKIWAMRFTLFHEYTKFLKRYKLLQ